MDTVIPVDEADVRVEQAVNNWFDEPSNRGRIKRMNIEDVKAHVMEFVEDEFNDKELTQKNLKEVLMDEDNKDSLVKDIRKLIKEEIDKNNEIMKKEMREEMKELYKQKREAPEYALHEDTYSMMMQSDKICSIQFLTGFLVWGFQVFMAVLNFSQLYYAGESSLPFDIPFQVSWEVRAGQFCCLFLLLSDIDDIYRPFHTIREALEKENQSVKHLFFPNILKFIAGLAVAVISILLIITTNELFDLFSNFAGLQFISNIDNEVYQMAKLEVLGEKLKKSADNVQKPLVKPKSNENAQQTLQLTSIPIQKFFKNYSKLIQMGVFIIIFILAAGIVLVAAMEKDNYFYETYPNCIIPPSRIDEYGNGKCDGGILNTIHCQFDGGDCTDFNEEYKDCKASRPYSVGDGQCDDGDDGDAFTPECHYDGGDCCDKRKLLKYSSVEEVLGGVCNPAFNIDVCLNDYGLCSESNNTDTECECQEQIESSSSGNIDSCGFKGAGGPMCISTVGNFTCEKKDNQCTRVVRDANPSRRSLSTRTIFILLSSLAVGFVIGIVGRALFKMKRAPAESDEEYSNQDKQQGMERNNDENLELGDDSNA
mmetsp:Transcript_22283/g.33997  ORF Transcript_22283/g.33997 Transcript_22283/m.33997 type:complete len:595 (-) Transcript_22283:83-1867(-)|eukprot:CAMPEP_0194117786 /NCGR_PEP_ID=MMETSP0150-20130528/32754_1 /TAXON_ID=122233 /ORGANISM="Chaetoceros debilis, Strain MM31A-1" /LENGTH=594 /DNA_ID=CAMNT_0038808933 /DNA_START=129 /DNA_END=1910 /DNA_ORIENTATION=+